MKNRNRLISHLRTSFCALVIVGALSTLPRAEAGTPQPASGGFFPCFNYAAPPRQVGDNLIITFNVTGTSTGTFTGSFVGTEMQVVHSDGSINLHGSLVLTGSIGNSSGTLVLRYEGMVNSGTGRDILQRHAHANDHACPERIGPTRASRRYLLKATEITKA